MASRKGLSVSSTGDVTQSSNGHRPPCEAHSQVLPPVEPIYSHHVVGRVNEAVRINQLANNHFSSSGPRKGIWFHIIRPFRGASMEQFEYRCLTSDHKVHQGNRSWDFYVILDAFNCVCQLVSELSNK